MTMANSALAADPSRADRAAFLFAYHISDAAKFDAAYRDHLAWHRDHKDHLVWYGWNIVAGPRTGMFIDGTFGSGFEAIDRRPALKEDGAHFAAGAGRYSTPAIYSGWSLWSAPSTDFGLENRKPSAMTDVLRIIVASDKRRSFENALIAAGKSNRKGLRWTWYRAAMGERIPSYLVFIPRADFAALASQPRNFGDLAVAAYGLSPATAERLEAMIESIDSETWRYRPDLSYFPSGD